jgi:hypothetical protein
MTVAWQLGKATIGIELTMTTPKIERLIEAVEARGALLSLAQQAED